MHPEQVLLHSWYAMLRHRKIKKIKKKILPMTRFGIPPVLLSNYRIRKEVFMGFVKGMIAGVVGVVRLVVTAAVISVVKDEKKT